MDIVALIMDQMPVIDLFSLSCTSNVLLDLAKKTMKQKLLKKDVLFQYPYHSFEGRNFETMNYETQDTVAMCALPKHVNLPLFLKNFGHLIQSVEVTHGPNSPEKVTKKLVTLINQYCAKTLKGFHITNFFENILTYVKPFEKVTKLSLNGEFDNVGNLDFLFPSARSLSLSAYTINHLRTFGLRMSNLRHLSVADQYDYVSDEMKTVLFNHHAIHSLSTEAASLKLLQYISDSMTALYSLSIDRIENNDEERQRIHFEKLKRFVLRGYMETMPTNVLLRDVEVFEVYNLGDSYFLIEYILEFAANLRKLVVMVNLSDNEFLQLADANLKVTEMKFQMQPDNDVRNIIYLMRNSARLTKMEIHIEDKVFMRSVFDELQNRLVWKWMILMNDSHLSLLSKSDFDVYPVENILN